jgi:hypothetical protein
MELLEFLIITIFVLYIIRMLVRIVMPMLFQKVMNNAQQHQQNRQQQNYTRSTKAEKIKVDYIPEQKKGSVPDSEGDFIDYEEIK